MAADLEARIKELESKVEELNDREALRNLRYRYHESVNEGKLENIAELFTEDGELEFGPLGHAKGKAKIAEFFRHLGPGATPGRGPHFSFVKQYIHNHVVEIHGDRATGFSYLEAKPIINGEATLVAARYDDDYVKRNGEWRFTRMGLTLHFMVPLREGWAQENRIKVPGGRQS